jgi:hypothetical protein
VAWRSSLLHLLAVSKFTSLRLFAKANSSLHKPSYFPFTSIFIRIHQLSVVD